MHKKFLILVSGLSCLLLVGCGTKTTPTQTIDTGMLFSGEQVVTGMQSGEIFSGQNTTIREEITGEISNGSLIITGQEVVPDIKASTGTVVITTGKSTPATVEELKKSLVIPSKTGTALTEDDIDNIDEAIQFIKDMFKN